MSPSRQLPLSRRFVLAGAGAGAAHLTIGTVWAKADPSVERHGLSIFGDLKYPPDFHHFDYVNPDAPKGGRLSTIPQSWGYNQNPNTFDSLNSLILKGRAAVGATMIFDSLMTRALDEPDAVYGLVAQSVRIEAGGKRFVFTLRPEARFHDGSALTSEDVVFSFLLLKEKGHPSITQTIKGLISVEADGPTRVVLGFDAGSSAGLPLTVSGLPILSKAYYTSHEFDQTTLEPPLGSSGYKIGRFEQGRYIEYERVPDYWGRDLGVNRGQGNFDIIRYEMYRDRTVAFEAFKAGQYLLRQESTARVWATQYDFPAVTDGRVVKFVLPDGSSSGAQGWYLNTRRPQFRDVRVREALGLLFDYEWTNKNVFYGSYIRTASYFENSEMKAVGKPSAAELALLEPFRGKVSDEVFGEPWVPPVSDGSGHDRALFRRASELFASAGWKSRDGALRNDKGETLKIEFLDNDTGLAPVLGPYIQNLKQFGIEASERVIDASQYQSRLESFDYDVVSGRFSLPATPDEAVREFWHSSHASIKGSSNRPGIADPVVDALIDTLLAAKSRAELVTAVRALDRVLRAGRYWVPHWYKASHFIAMWDVYARPKITPTYARGLESTWWVDRAKAEKLGKAL